MRGLGVAIAEDPLGFPAVGFVEVVDFCRRDGGAGGGGGGGSLEEEKTGVVEKGVRGVGHEFCWGKVVGFYLNHCGELRFWG